MSLFQVRTISTGTPGLNGRTDMTISNPKTGQSVSGGVEHAEGCVLELRGRLLEELSRKVSSDSYQGEIE